MKRISYIAALSLLLAACNPNSGVIGYPESPAGNNNGGGGGSNSGNGAQVVSTIPADDDADPNPQVTPNVVLPGITSSVTTEEGEVVIQLDMTGVMDPVTGEYLQLFGTNSSQQNVWVEVEGMPKGISVENLSAQQGATTKADLIFLVDNSGSMSEEADAIAEGILTWSNLLSQSGVDIKFGVVGYDGEITGGLDVTDATTLSTFLDYSTGTYRTYHFEGNNAQTLAADAPNYYNGGGMDECGMAAFHFANDHFNFRSGATRVYVNFTDEPNYYLGIDKFRTSWLLNNWQPYMGTIHNVYSDGVDAEQWANESEGSHDLPWKMAEYTGGTKLFVNSDFSGITLSDLPVTGALQNSYIIRFTNIDELIDGNTHEVTITIKTADGNVAGVITLYITFS